MLIPALIIMLIGFIIYLLGYVAPKFLPESAYSLIFNIPAISIFGLILLFIGMILFFITILKKR